MNDMRDVRTEACEKKSVRIRMQQLRFVGIVCCVRAHFSCESRTVIKNFICTYIQFLMDVLVLHYRMFRSFFYIIIL